MKCCNFFITELDRLSIDQIHKNVPRCTYMQVVLFPPLALLISLVRNPIYRELQSYKDTKL